MKDLIKIEIEIKILIETIKEKIIKGKQRIENTIENEKTTTYWNIGKHIYQHLLDFSDRAEYGESLYKILGKQLNMRARALYTAIQYYQTYPKILPARAQLIWSHYRILVTIQDGDKRKEYEQRIVDENLSTRELQELINKDKDNKSNGKISKLTEIRGLLNTYKLKTYENDPEFLDIDLGFRTYTDRLDNKTKYTKDSIITIEKKKKTYNIIKTEKISLHSLYTYKGILKEIIDGDTLWVYLNLGFGITSCRKV